MIIPLIFFFVALIYSMVGLGGGSAYVAFLSLSEIDLRYLPSTALFLNIVVTTIGFSHFKSHIQQLRNKTILFLIVSSLVGVLIGTMIHLNEREFRLFLGIVLVVASSLTFQRGKMRRMVYSNPDSPPRLQSIAVTGGFIIGLIAGLFGIGGGVFLAPLLLLSGVAVKEVAAVTSLYILVNSTIGFLSHSFQGNVNPQYLLNFAIFVLVGALVGAHLGSKRLQPKTLVQVLTVLIFLIGVRLIWTTIL